VRRWLHSELWGLGAVVRRNTSKSLLLGSHWTHVLLQHLQEVPYWRCCRWAVIVLIIIIIIIIIQFKLIRRPNMSMTSLQGRRIIGSHDECRTAPDGRRPLDPRTWAIGPPVSSYETTSTIAIIITQPPYYTVSNKNGQLDFGPQQSHVCWYFFLHFLHQSKHE